MTEPPAPAAPRRPLRTAALALGLALAVSLVAVGWLQWRQQRLLDATVRFQDDSLQINMGQLQVEFLRLRAALQAARHAPEPDRAAVQLRYDIFVSRVDLLHAGRAELLAPSADDYRTVVARLRDFIVQADTVLGPQAGAAWDVQAAAQLDQRLASLDSPLQALVLGGTTRMTAQIAERYDTVREQGRAGVVLTVLLSASSVGFALVAFTLLGRELRRRRALETLAGELRLAQHEAESASHAKSAFLANMSHELRTPFQGLLGMLQLLDTERLAPDQRRQLDTARQSAQHLLAVLNDILDMARLEAGTLLISANAVDLRELLTEVRTLMAAAAQAKGLRLDVSVAPALPACVLIDDTRTRQILFNLVSNAIKFTEQGGITVDAQAHGDRLVLAVIDSGPGIDAALRPRLFQRFSQGDESTSRRHGGTGLGLEISRTLARLMGGDIALASPPGQGSRFELTLPLVAAVAPLERAAEVALPPPPAARRLHLLAAEDNEVNRMVLGAMVERCGHQVSFANDGFEAVEAMRQGSFDLVLMDLHMPGMDGIDATRAIRAMDTPAAAVPIVALTADVFSDTRERCERAGMDAFLTKPVGVAELAQLLGRYAELPQASVPAASG